MKLHPKPKQHNSLPISSEESCIVTHCFRGKKEQVSVNFIQQRSTTSPTASENDKATKPWISSYQKAARGIKDCAYQGKDISLK